MTELLHPVDAPSDAELISRVRAGDHDAYGELFTRHVEAARRLARQLVRGPDSDDLVSDAFTKVMAVLQGGGGPDVAFRAYLLTAVRRLHVDRIRAQSRLTPTDDLTPFDPGVPFQDTALERFESGAAARAFASLPERWQLVLWHLEVEGQKPAEVAPLLGMSANSVSALAYRAREGLRQAFLTAHLNELADDDCRWVVENLGGYVRDGLSKRDSGKVREHLDRCRSCTAMYLELTEVNSNLAGVIAPLLLGGLAAGYLGGSGGGAAAGGAFAGLTALLDRAKDLVVGNSATVATGSAVAGAAVVTAVALTVVGGPDPSPSGSAPTPPAASQEGDEAPSATRADRDRPDTAQRPRRDAAARPAGLPTTDARVTSASVSDDALVVDVSGLPATPSTVVVRLESATGATTFSPDAGRCAVGDADRSTARCSTAAGGGRTGVFRLAPRDYTVVAPLSYPESLERDTLSVVVEVDGYDDTDPSDNTLTFEFVPSTRQVPSGQGSPPGATPAQPPGPAAQPSQAPPTQAPPTQAPPSGTPKPKPTPTDTPTASPGQDLSLSLRGRVGKKTVDKVLFDVAAAVRDIGPRGGQLTFDVKTSHPEVRLDDVSPGCAPTAGGTRVTCTAKGNAFNPRFDFSAPMPPPAEVTVTLTVTLAGNTDPDPADNTASTRLGLAAAVDSLRDLPRDLLG